VLLTPPQSQRSLQRACRSIRCGGISIFAESVGNSITCRRMLNLRSSLLSNWSPFVGNSVTFSTLSVDFVALPPPHPYSKALVSNVGKINPKVLCTHFGIYMRQFSLISQYQFVLGAGNLPDVDIVHMNDRCHRAMRWCCKRCWKSPKRFSMNPHVHAR